MNQNQSELRPVVFLVALTKVLEGPTLEEIRIYLRDKPAAQVEAVVELVGELVEVGALRRDGDRYLPTTNGEALVRQAIPDALKSWEYVRSTLSVFLELGGATMEQLAMRFGSGQADGLFRELIHRFVTQGTLDLRRDGRYYVSEQARFRYRLGKPH